MTDILLVVLDASVVGPATDTKVPQGGSETGAQTPRLHASGGPDACPDGARGGGPPSFALAPRLRELRSSHSSAAANFAAPGIAPFVHDESCYSKCSDRVRPPPAEGSIQSEPHESHDRQPPAGERLKRVGLERSTL